MFSVLHPCFNNPHMVHMAEMEDLSDLASDAKPKKEDKGLDIDDLKLPD